MERILTQRTQSSQRTAKRVRLDEVCEMNMGQSPDSKSYNQDRRGLPFYQGNADFGLLHPVPRYWCDCPTKIAEANDILISVRAPIGALNIADSKCCIGRGLASLRPASCCELLYLYYFLKANVAELNAKGTGSTFKAINKKSLAEVSVPLPPLSEQKRIAAALDKICEMKRNVESRLQKLDLLIKSRFSEMFGDPAETTDRWDVVSMSNVIDSIENGKSFVCESHPRRNFEPAILKLSAATWGVYNADENKALKPGDEFVSNCEVRTGDLLFTRKNTFDLVGMCAYVRETPPKLMLPDLIFRLKTNGKIDKIFLANLINFPTFRKNIRNLASGSAASMPNISKARLLELQIPLPPLPLQREFAAFVEKVEGMKAVAKMELEKVDLLYRAKLQEYFG